MRYAAGMSHEDTPPDVDSSSATRAAVCDAIQADLRAAAASRDATSALPHLRAAADQLTGLIDDTMALAVVTGRSLRSVGAGAGLSENAVGPRLARTSLLAAYANDSGRVTASGVERARYDHETGQPRESPQQHAPLRFKMRRTT